MKSRLATGAALALVCALGLGACGGGGAKSNIQTSNSTIGQELMDLDESYKKGLISEKEYNAAKKQILQRYK